MVVEQPGGVEVGDSPAVSARALDADVPDLAALYALHKDAMYRVVYATLRSSGLVDLAEDAVSAAIVSIMQAGLPTNIVKWEAFLVTAAKRKALDLLKSAAVRHAGSSLEEHHGRASDGDVAEDVVEEVDLERRVRLLRESLHVLDERQRLVAVELIGAERPRAEITAELGVTPGRVSQMKVQVLKLLCDEMTRREDRR